MDSQKIVTLLEGFAPTSLAGGWDNVGLLVEPTAPHNVSTVCLTNDLTEEVLDEAIGRRTDLVLSYHPPIFMPLKRLTMRNAKERIIVRAIENRIAIYSPHTCYDAVEGGVNDWLVKGLGETSSSHPLDPCKEVATPSGDDFSISGTSSASEAGSIIQGLSGVHDMTTVAAGDSKFFVSCSCRKSELGRVVSSIQEMKVIDQQSLRITQLAKAPMVKTGVGRLATLKQPALVSTMVERIKLHLKLSHVQIAVGQGKTMDSEISTVAICAGSGASVLKNVKADIYLTGEMSHHDILAAVAMGTTVVVCNHSNTERGFLHVLQEKLTEMFEGKVAVFVSEQDRDPLEVV